MILPTNNLQLLSLLVVICEELWITKSNKSGTPDWLEVRVSQRFEVSF
jgi:hypothetical protein